MREGMFQPHRRLLTATEKYGELGRGGGIQSFVAASVRLFFYSSKSTKEV